MINKDISSQYSKYYNGKKLSKLYPTEFVVRSFLGSYENLKPNPQTSFLGKKVLDLGCGDGRNIPFLNDLGYEVYGLEINKEIVEFCFNNIKFNNYEAILKIGDNSNTGFLDRFFDCIVACHSFYYLKNNDSFHTNLDEISRILKKGGRFVFSIPNHESYLLRDADFLGGGYAIVRSDPLNIRNGLKIKFFENEYQIIESMNNKFDSFKIGLCENNWWGCKEFYWTVVCSLK